MKTFLPHTVAMSFCLLGLLGGQLRAQGPVFTAPTLDDALKIKGGKSLILQPLQMKPGQKLLVTHAGSAKNSARGATQYGVLLAVYSTDPADYGTLLFQDLFTPAAGAGAGPHVKVFNGFTPTFAQGVTQRGIIAILIGLLMPANNGDAVPAVLPGADSISAEVHDPNVGIGMLLPAVQKVREAAVR
jgi:hypothetical protein